MALSSPAFLFMAMKKKFIFVIIILLFISFLYPIYTLEVRVDGTEELVYHQSAKIGDTFNVEWIHSVTLQPVIETYKLKAPKQLPIVKMIFDDYGPNLPAHPEYNQKWIIEQDGTVNVIDYNRVFERVPVTIGAVIADHALVYNGKTTHLKDVYRPGGFVHIGLVKETLAQYLFKEVQIWQKMRK